MFCVHFFNLVKNTVISAFLDPFRGCKRMSSCTLTPLLVRGGFRNFSDLSDSASASRATKRSFGLNHDQAPSPLTLALGLGRGMARKGLLATLSTRSLIMYKKGSLMVCSHQQVSLNTPMEQLTLNMR